MRGKETVSPGMVAVHKYPLGSEGRLVGKGWSLRTFRPLMMKANYKFLRDGKEPLKGLKKSGREGLCLENKLVILYRVDFSRT